MSSRLGLIGPHVHYRAGFFVPCGAGRGTRVKTVDSEYSTTLYGRASWPTYVLVINSTKFYTKNLIISTIRRNTINYHFFL